jgi:hypothetical protein
MLTQVIFSARYLGPSFVANNGATYYLCDGQALSRTTNSKLSDVWPVNAYGSTVNNIHLPPLEGLYLRGYDFGSGRDSEAASRTALSGSLPTGNNIGAYQPANLKLHTHVNGRQGGSGPCADGAGQDGGSSPDTPIITVTSNSTSLNTLNSTVAATVSGTTTTAFDVSNCSFWVYIEGSN